MKIILENKVYSEKIKGLEDLCSGCRDATKMYSTGYLSKYNDSRHWVIEFKCSYDGEINEIWDIKYESLIQEVLKDEGIE